MSKPDDVAKEVIDQIAADKAAFYQMEKDYAKQAFEASGCRWRVSSITAPPQSP